MKDFPRRQKSIRFTLHALVEIQRRELDFAEALATAQAPEEIVLADEGRFAYLRRYYDRESGKTMLMRLIVEESETEIVIVTAHMTSRIARYMKGLN